MQRIVSLESFWYLAFILQIRSVKLHFFSCIIKSIIVYFIVLFLNSALATLNKGAFLSQKIT